jgi:hypothetical protein
MTPEKLVDVLSAIAIGLFLACWAVSELSK